MIVRTTVCSAVLVVAVVLAIVLVTSRGDTPQASAATQTITICKVTSPPGGGGFPFNWTAGSSGAQPGFSLNDGQCSILDVTVLDKYNVITEVVPANWTLTNIACNSGTSPVSIVNSSGNPTPNPGGGSAFAPGDDTVAIDLNEANRTCTFTNTCSIAVCPTPVPTPTPSCPPGIICTPTPSPSPTRPPTATPTPTPTPTPQPGSVTICKVTDPLGGTGFSFRWSSPTIHTAPFPLNGGQCTTFSGLNPADGPYSATEITPLPAGWTLTNIVCTGGANIVIGSNALFDPGDTGATINLNPGENITCTFTNTAPCATTNGYSINTGNIAIGGIDPIWTLSSAPNSVPIPDAYAVPGDYGPWVAPSSTASNWLDPNNTGGPPPGTFPPTDPQGTYVFDTSFIAPAGAQSFTLNFRFAADNNVKFYLNNVLIPGTTVNSAWSTLHGPATITQPNPSGTYTLTARVVNGTGPTGLLVEGTLKCTLAGTPHTHGNVNCDAAINLGDFDLLLRHAADLDDDTTAGSCPNLDTTLPAVTATHPWGDLNCDDLVNAADALLLLTHLAAIDPAPNPDCPALGDELP